MHEESYCQLTAESATIITFLWAGPQEPPDLNASGLDVTSMDKVFHSFYIVATSRVQAARTPGTQLPHATLQVPARQPTPSSGKP